MPYQVAVTMRRGGDTTFGPYDTEHAALLGLLERRGTVPNANDTTWRIAPVRADSGELLKLRVALFDPQHADFVRGPFHLVGPRLRFEPPRFAHARHPEQFIHAIAERAGVWLVLGNRDEGDDASDAVRGAYRFEPTPERLIFLRALADLQPGLHDPRYRELHDVGGKSLDVLAAPDLFAVVFPELEQADHARLALDYHCQHVAALAKWHAAIEHAAVEHGADPLAFELAGVQKEWPLEHRSEVFALARAAADLQHASEAHWRAAFARTRVPPWAPSRRRTILDGDLREAIARSEAGTSPFAAQIAADWLDADEAGLVGSVARAREIWEASGRATILGVRGLHRYEVGPDGEVIFLRKHGRAGVAAAEAAGFRVA